MLWGKEGVATAFIISHWLKRAKSHLRQAPVAVAVEPDGGRSGCNCCPPALGALWKVTTSAGAEQSPPTVTKPLLTVPSFSGAQG